MSPLIPVLGLLIPVLTQVGTARLMSMVGEEGFVIQHLLLMATSPSKPQVYYLGERVKPCIRSSKNERVRKADTIMAVPRPS